MKSYRQRKEGRVRPLFEYAVYVANGTQPMGQIPGPQPYYSPYGPQQPGVPHGPFLQMPPLMDPRLCAMQGFHGPLPFPMFHDNRRRVILPNSNVAMQPPVGTHQTSGMLGVDEARARLNELPWYGKSILPSLQAQQTLAKLDQWHGSKLLPALYRQYRGMLKCRNMIHAVVDTLSEKSNAAVTENTIDAFKEALWKRMGQQMSTEDTIRAASLHLNLPDDVLAHLDSDSNFNSDSYDNHDRQEDVAQLISRLGESKSRDIERIEEKYTELRNDVKSAVDDKERTYGEAVRTILTNPNVGVRPNAPFSTSTGLGLLAAAGAQRLLPEPEYAAIGAEDGEGPLTQDNKIFSTPLAVTIPNCSMGWYNQMELMTLLGHPPDSVAADARMKKLGDTLKKIEKQSGEWVKAISFTQDFMTALKKALNDRTWSSERADIRWYRACVLNRLDAFLRSTRTGNDLYDTVGNIDTSRSIAIKKPLDYEYLRLLAAAREQNRSRAEEIVYDWLTRDPDSALFVAEYESGFGMIRALVSRRALKREGIESEIVTGDKERQVEPISLTLQRADRMDLTAGNGGQNNPPAGNGGQNNPPAGGGQNNPNNLGPNGRPNGNPPNMNGGSN